MRGLTLERRDQENRTPPPVAGMSFPPPVGEGYWSYRVRLTNTQAVLGFPKRSTVGVGFAVEPEDGYDLNLPYNCPTADIVRHIGSNRGDESITDDDVFAAVLLIQRAALEDMSEIRRVMLGGLRDADYMRPFPPVMVDTLCEHLNRTRREQVMMLAEIDRLTALAHTLSASEDRRVVFLESELNRATAELELLRGAAAAWQGGYTPDPNEED